MLKLYKAQFFYPFAIEQGTFKELEKDKKKRKGNWFFSTTPVEEFNPETFAEYKYFHSHARELLFKAKSLLVYEVNEKKIQGWTIDVKIPPRSHESCWREKSVKLDWVMMYIYDLDVGVLSFGVVWDRNDEFCKKLPELNFDDVLDINNFIRRSSPSFLDYSDVKNAKKMGDTNQKVGGRNSKRI